MNNTLIVFASNHGTVEKSARLLFDMIHGNVDICDLDKRDAPIDLTSYDAVIIGGSIHFKQIQPSVTNFCNTHLKQLMTKKIGLFINCLHSGDIAREQLEAVFPAELRKRAVAIDYFGGEIIELKLSSWEVVVISVMLESGLLGNVSLSADRIRAFADSMNCHDKATM